MILLKGTQTVISVRKRIPLAHQLKELSVDSKGKDWPAGPLYFVCELWELTLKKKEKF